MLKFINLVLKVNCKESSINKVKLLSHLLCIVEYENARLCQVIPLLVENMY